MPQQLPHAARRPRRRSPPRPVRAPAAPREADAALATAAEWRRLRRLLILGTDGRARRAGVLALGAEQAALIERCLRADGLRAVDEIVAAARGGRAPSAAPALFALGLACELGSLETRRAALAALPLVAATSAELFAFLAQVGGLHGLRRSLRRAVAAWYAARPLEALGREVIEGRADRDLGHRDVLRLAHPAGLPSAESPGSEASHGHGRLFEWIVRGGPAPPRPAVVRGFVRVQSVAAPARAAGLVREYRLPAAALRPDQLTEASVWAALLEAMPIADVLANLATMTRVGLLVPGSPAAREVARRLADAGPPRDGGIGPIAILVALRAYAAAGGGYEPVPAIVAALERALDASFARVEPTGRRILVALDVSSSMALGSLAGVPGLTPRLVATAMALAGAASEPHCEIVAFQAARRRRRGARRSSALDGLAPVAITPRQGLDDALATVSRLPFGDTDPALPIRYAQELGRRIDAFVLYTDIETSSVETHPAAALAEYRRRSGIDARLVVVALAGGRLAVADPGDPGMLDLFGFDLAVPQLVTEFVRGEL